MNQLLQCSNYTYFFIIIYVTITKIIPIKIFLNFYSSYRNTTYRYILGKKLYFKGFFDSLVNVFMSSSVMILGLQMSLSLFYDKTTYFRLMYLLPSVQNTRIVCDIECNI